MEKLRNLLFIVFAMMLLMGCAASRKVEQSGSEERRDSVASIVMDSVKKSETSTDSSVTVATSESSASATMTDKGSNEETITERVTESVDASGNKTTTTDRTIHRKGDYERNTTYEARLKQQEETISRLQHTIDSLVLSKRLDAGTHWAKKDSTSAQKDVNTKDVKASCRWDRIFSIVLLIILIGICKWLWLTRK